MNRQFFDVDDEVYSKTGKTPKEIIETWLCESGTAYMRRRSRTATRNSYERCVRMYFALVIHNSAR